jgi:hypothetical protein
LEKLHGSVIAPAVFLPVSSNGKRGGIYGRVFEPPGKGAAAVVMRRLVSADFGVH